MLVYYNGFGPGNQYDLSLYPRTANTLRLKIRRANFLAYAEYNAGLLPPLPPKPQKTEAGDQEPTPTPPRPRQAGQKERPGVSPGLSKPLA